MSKPRRQTPKQLRRTAIHEAGHAVARCVLGLKFQFVAVYPEGKVFKEWVEQEDGSYQREDGARSEAEHRDRR